MNEELLRQPDLLVRVKSGKVIITAILSRDGKVRLVNCFTKAEFMENPILILEQCHDKAMKIIERVG